SGAGQRWLLEFAAAAERTDRFAGKPDHIALLAAGLIGEAGSVVAELKKERRERGAYPGYSHRMLEELGDFLWYYVRLVSLVDRALLPDRQASTSGGLVSDPRLSQFLSFGASVGDLLRAVVDGHSGQARELRPQLQRVWCLLVAVSSEAAIPLH